jgi:hypothetical protein
MQGHYLYPEGNPTPSRSWYCLLASKDKKLLKIEKDSRMSQKLPKNFLKGLFGPSSIVD